MAPFPSMHALSTAPPPFANRCDALDLERAAAQEQAEATAEQLEDLKRRLAALELDAQAARSEAAQQASVLGKHHVIASLITGWPPSSCDCFPHQASVLGKQQQQLEALAAQARLPETIDEPLMTASRRPLTNL